MTRLKPLVAELGNRGAPAASAMCSASESHLPKDAGRVAPR